MLEYKDQQFLTWKELREWVMDDVSRLDFIKIDCPVNYGRFIKLVEMFGLDCHFVETVWGLIFSELTRLTKPKERSDNHG